MAALPPPAPPPPPPPLPPPGWTATAATEAAPPANTVPAANNNSRSSNGAAVATTSDAVSQSAQQSSTSPDGSKSWEKPWTPKDIKGNANQWSLAGDAALLLHLKEMSQKMISKTHDLSSEVNGLVSEVKVCGVTVNNAFNEFITLANSQFVENRVYDEDVQQETEETAPKVEKTREEKEADLVPKITEAVKLGLSVLDTAYDKLDLNVGDESDEDEPYQGEPLLEAKDPYVLRPLPYLIGSVAFSDNDNVGLLDIPSDEVASDHGSISESEDEEPPQITNLQPHAGSDDSEYSYSDDSESVPSRRNTQRQPAQKSDSSDETGDSDDMFGTKPKPPVTTESSSEDEDESDGELRNPPKPAAPVDFASELANKLGMPAQPAPKTAPSNNRQRSGSQRSQASTKAAAKKEKKNKKKKQQVNEDDMFGAPSDDDDGLFGKQSGLFSSGGGLFDDKQDEGGLFDDVADLDVSQLKKKGKKHVSSESDEEESDDSAPPKKTHPAKQTPAKVQQPKAKPATDLFDDDSDDDMFAAVTKAKPQKSSARASDLFDGGSSGEDEPMPAAKQREQERPRTASGKKIPAGAVSMFGSGGNPLAAALNKRRQLSDEDDDDWTTSGKSSRETSVPKEVKSVNKTQPSTKPAAKGLFSDSDEDDLFGGSSKSDEPKPEPVKKEPPKKKMPAGAVSMFGGAANPLAAALNKRKQSSSSSASDDDEEAVAPKQAPSKVKDSHSKPPPKPAAKGLFSDSDEEDDLFSGNTTKRETEPKVEDPPKKKVPAGAVSMFGGGSNPLAADLNNRRRPSTDEEEEENDDWTSSSRETSEPKQTQVKSLEQNAKQVAKQADKPTAKGLFSDSDGEDLFGGSTKSAEPEPEPIKTEPPKKKMPAGAVSMFGGNSNPLADALKKRAQSKLTSESEPENEAETKPAATADKTVKQPVSVTSVSKPDLFDEDGDDDDLFSSMAKSKPTAKTSAPSQIKKPAGGASPHSTSLSKNKHESKVPVKSSMFSESDDDDMFSTTKKAPTVITASEPKSLPAKKAPASSGLFSSPDEEDDIFASVAKPKSISTVPSNSLFGSPSSDEDFLSSKVVKKEEPAKQPGKQKKETVKTKKSAEPSGIFGSPDSSDDMFGSTSVKVPPKPEAKVNSNKGASAAKSADPLGIAGDDDLVTSNIPPAESMQTDPLAADTGTSADVTTNESHPEPPKESPKPRRPAGAVSMFGGMDPAALLKKKKITPTAELVEPKERMPPVEPPRHAPPQRRRKEKQTLFNSDSSDDDLFSSPSRPKNIVVEKSASAPVAKVANSKPKQGGVGALASKISFNPAALLPGAAPPVKESTKSDVDFDLPPENKNILQSANKSRARIQQKRRPPSRHIRVGESASVPTASPPNKPIISEAPTSQPINNPLDAPSLTENQVNGHFDEDPLAKVENWKPSPIPASPVTFKTKPPITLSDTEDETDQATMGEISETKQDSPLQRESPPRLVSSPPILVDSMPENDDLFTPVPSELEETVKEVLPSGRDGRQFDPFASDSDEELKVGQSNGNTKSIIEQDPDDLFNTGVKFRNDTTTGSDSLFTEAPVKQFVPPEEEPEPVIVKNASTPSTFVLDDDDDDMFATKKPGQKTKAAGVMDDLDELFADLPSLKPKNSTTTPMKDDDDDDDLFAPVKKVARKPRAVTKDQDLFGDDDDIFGDLMSTKPKERKPKTSTTRVKKTVNDDDFDDLLADLAPTKSKARIKKISPLEDDDDLFSDPLSGLK